MIAHSHSHLSGRFRCQVLDGATKQVLRDTGWEHNLVTNNGMEFGRGFGVGINGVSEFTRSCYLGTGTAPNKTSSGATQATQAGTAITLSGGSFTFTSTAVDAGRVIKWESGEETMIQTVQSATAATAYAKYSKSVAAGVFTLFNTNFSALQNEVTFASGTVYYTGNSSCGYEFDVTGSVDPYVGELTLRRAWEFPPETTSRAYGEVSFGSIYNDLHVFSRGVFSPVINVVPGNQVRVFYEFHISFSPIRPRIVDPASYSLPGVSSMTEHFEFASLNLVDPITGGTLLLAGKSPICEPGQLNSTYGFVSDSSIALPEVCYITSDATPQYGGTNLKISESTLTDLAYVPLSFEIYRYVSFGPKIANFPIRTIGILVDNISFTTRVAYVLRPNVAFTKTNLERLNFTFKTTWSRELA